MLKPGIILNRLYERLESFAKNRRVIDLRIGLGYIGVRLDNDSTGIAAVLFDALPHGCTVVSAAGNFAGSPATDLLQYLVGGKNPLEIGMGLATANALIEPPPTDAVDDRIRATGAELTVIEKNSARMEILGDAEKKDALKSCDVAIITATTLLNNTFEEIINLLGRPRAAAIMGPSTPLMPAIFHNTPVTHLGGVIVADSSRVMQIISEGGGTPALRPYLRFVNLILNRTTI